MQKSDAQTVKINPSYFLHVEGADKWPRPEIVESSGKDIVMTTPLPSAEKQARLNSYFMKMAELTAENSFAIRSKVGAVLVKEGRCISAGWNGTPYGFPNDCEEIVIVEEPNGLQSKKLVTLPHVIHAETNVICFCAKHGIKTDGTSLYITLSPCEKCALLLIQAGVKRVYYKDAYRDLTGVEILQKSGIEVEQLKV